MSGCAFAWEAKCEGGGYRRSSSRIVSMACSCLSTPSAIGYCDLGLQIVRVVRQQLGAVIRDEHEILEPAAAETVPVEPGLERDHVALDELARVSAQPGLLVHFESDAVTEAVEEPVLEHLAVALVQPGGIAGLVEELARQHVDVPAGDARLDGGERPLERLLDELVVGDELLGRLADDDGPRHV